MDQTTQPPNSATNPHTPNTTTHFPTPAHLPASIKLEKFAELTEDTYEQWARTAKANLVVGGYWPFFCGKRPKPATDSEDWVRFNQQLVAYLRTRMHPTLQHHLDDVQTAEGAWDMLRAKFREKGTVGQHILLQTALRTRFTRTSAKGITEKIHKLNGVIDHFFEIGVPSPEEWKSMFFLHALGDDGEFEMMREMLLATGSLTSQKIIQGLEHEAQRLQKRTEGKEAREIAFLARETQTRPKTSNLKPNGGYSNCGYTNHTVEKCFRPGGPLFSSKQKEREMPKEKDRRRKLEEKKREKASTARESSDR